MPIEPRQPVDPVSQVGTSDRRRAPRHAVALPVHVAFPGEGLSGTSADVSDVGVLCVTDEPLELVVRIEQDGGTVERRGRLVRAQQLGAVSFALAIEFDEED